MEAELLDTYYTGLIAASYVRNRVGPKWCVENAAVEELLTSVPHGASVLDAPIGTGRFLPIYKSRFLKPHGIDVSADMLAQARLYADAVGVFVDLIERDIRQLPFADNRFDAALCVRFVNLVGAPGIGEVLKELARVSRSHVLIGVRYLTPFRDLGFGLPALVRRCARLLGLTRYRSGRLGRNQYRKSEVDAAIREAGLEPFRSRHLERRWDGTDYVFLLLHKARRSAGA